MKPTKIPCDYLGRGGSRRAEILFSAIEPHLKVSMTYLDIGCGTAPLTIFIDDHTWLCVRSDAFVIETHHDVVIHTGINSRRFNDAEIHGRILDTPDSGPSVVLLESGDYHDGPSDTHEIYEEIRELYRGRGFLLKREEVLVISHFPVPVRRYAVFIRS
jgi:hypothetical protein